MWYGVLAPSQSSSTLLLALLLFFHPDAADVPPLSHWACLQCYQLQGFLLWVSWSNSTAYSFALRRNIAPGLATRNNSQHRQRSL
jgi:hypothetical protein